MYLRHLNHAFVKTRSNKHCIKLKHSRLLHPLWHLWQQKCKNSWQERARTRARKGDYRYFHNSNVPFPISISERGISRLLNLYWKQHVSFNKTTRRSQQNNTSFSTKQHVVFNKTTRCFRQNNTSFSTKQTVGWEEAARAFGQYPLRTMPNKRRRTEKQQKTKYPWFDKLELSKSRVRKIFCCFSAFFFTLCSYFNPYINEGDEVRRRKCDYEKHRKAVVHLAREQLQCGKFVEHTGLNHLLRLFKFAHLEGFTISLLVVLLRFVVLLEFTIRVAYHH